MKKVFSFFGAALFVAAMTVSCGNNNTEATDSVCDSANVEAACCEQQAAQPVEAVAMTDAEHQAMLDAAAEAGRAKCNCYKTDAASVEACIKGILAQSYAAYQDNEEFKAAMEAEFNSCVKEKATAAIKDAANEGIKEGAKALSNALKK
ncbi:MAG: hypothetical protein IJ634_01900 [Bacteroidales bacterium]|nr:hypothetical protein [Bacteroidales bacterium]